MMAIHSNLSFGSASPVEGELHVLRSLVESFTALEEQTAGPQELYHRVLAVVHQPARIMRTLLEHPGTARILSVACGSCPDLRNIAAHLPTLLGELWLNDNDVDALSFSARALGTIRDRSHFRPGNALKVVRKIA